MSSSHTRRAFGDYGSGGSSRRRHSPPPASTASSGGPFNEKATLRELARDWPELGDKNFNPVGLALSLLDSSSMGKDRHQFKVAISHLEEVVDTIVATHHKDFNATIDAYSGTLDGVNAAQQKAKEMRDKLMLAKDRLRLRRADLVGHWVKTRQYQEMMSLLDQIDTIKAAPAKLDSLARRKRYPEAVKYVLDMIALSNDAALGEIGALSELRRRFILQKGALYEAILNDIQGLLYQKGPGSNGLTLGEDDDEEVQVDAPIKLFDWKPPTQSSAEKSGWSEEEVGSKGFKSSSDSASPSSFSDETSDELADKITQDPPIFMESLIISLQRLDRLIEGLETLQQRIPGELHRLADQAVASAVKLGHEPVTLLRSLSFRFLRVLESHWLLREKVVLLTEASEPILGHRIQEVGQRTFKEAWLGVQGEIKSVFYDYLGSDASGRGRLEGPEGPGNSGSSMALLAGSNVLDGGGSGSTGGGGRGAGGGGFVAPVVSVEEILRDKKRLRDKKKKLFRLGGKEGNGEVMSAYEEVLTRLEMSIPSTAAGPSNDPSGPESLHDGFDGDGSLLGGVGHSISSARKDGGYNALGGAGPLDPYAIDGGANDRRGHILLAKPEPAVVATFFRPSIEFLSRVRKITNLVDVRDLLAFLEDYYTTFFIPRCSPQLLTDLGGVNGLQTMIKDILDISPEASSDPVVDESRTELSVGSY